MSKVLRLSCAASILALATAASPTLAQDAQSQDEQADENVDTGSIIVTARRRDERLVDVPVAVSAFGEEELQRRGAVDITDVAQITPNTTLEESRGTNSTLSAFIRGIGQQDPVSGFEQGVGIYLDDVYLNRPQAAVLDIYDIERIEVLRGPQGTLYGRNTIGGAVKYVTRELPDEPTLRLRGTVGTYERAEGVVTASTPINDIVRIGASVARLSRGGFGENLTTGLDNYNKDIWAGRGTLEVGGNGEPYLIRFSGDYTADRSNARGGSRLIPGAASGAPVLDDVFDTRGGLVDPEQDVEAYGFALNARLDLTDALTLRSISAYRTDESASPIDFDALPAVDLDVPAIYANEQFSQEVQLIWDVGGPFTGLLGGYFLDASADTLFDVRLFTLNPVLLPGFTAFTQANVDTETFAVFGDFTYELTEQLSLSVGGRYTWDERTADILRQNFLFGGSPIFGGDGFPLGGPSTDFSGSEDFNKFTPRASLSFMPTPDHQIYVSYSQGFKGGGFDPRGVGVNAPATTPGNPTNEEIADFLSFAPETVDSYEIGYKGDLLDGALYIALAGFYADYTDVQIPGSVACNVGGIATFCGVVSNAGAAEFMGVELETSARIAEDLSGMGDELRFTGALGWIDADYTEFVTNIGGVPTDVSDFREVQNTPEWSGAATLGYTTPMGGGDLYLGSTLSFRSATTQFEIPNPFLDQGSYALLDASIVYNDDAGWSLGLYGRNLTDHEYITSGYTFIAIDPVTGDPVLTNGQPTPNLGTEGTLTAFYGNPRQVYLTATIEF
ncbi:TonB-dependent receptor [Aurantiacibacter gangjinensis]|uniref:TonB-dependent receptor n=1 Tax=Aurantiacibacter gangjinensis TaxID=502682 RepID=A0A0G9MQY5_9SPHN|nr:TonB-dependent receptor [Aurantiacibacter gangjinensis]APE29039.1 Outer membrane receptor proteins, mostly Fe transport [Aurantiacibacter gangjinensis]KLE33136.1 TonB-dependent receptor [Aurantiacibacter gangjinensis]